MQLWWNQDVSLTLYYANAPRPGGLANLLNFNVRSVWCPYLIDIPCGFFSLIRTLSRHNFLDLGSSVGCAGQKGSWDGPERSQALQHGATYLVAIRSGPELWSSGKNPNSLEVGVMGEPSVWVGPVGTLTHYFICSQNCPFWGIFLSLSVVRKNLVRSQCRVAWGKLCISSVWTSLHNWHGEPALAWRISKERHQTTYYFSAVIFAAI